MDRATAELATVLASRYGLKAADATHLATAVAMGADRFVTNNQRDFPVTIAEVKVTYPADLTEAPRVAHPSASEPIARAAGKPWRSATGCLRDESLPQASRSMGQLMQRGPPRPRPSSPPGTGITVMPLSFR